MDICVCHLRHQHQSAAFVLLFFGLLAVSRSLFDNRAGLKKEESSLWMCTHLSNNFIILFKKQLTKTHCYTGHFLIMSALPVDASLRGTAQAWHPSGTRE